MDLKLKEMRVGDRLVVRNSMTTDVKKFATIENNTVFFNKEAVVVLRDNVENECMNIEFIRKPSVRDDINVSKIGTLTEKVLIEGSYGSIRSMLDPSMKVWSLGPIHHVLALTDNELFIPDYSYSGNSGWIIDTPRIWKENNGTLEVPYNLNIVEE